ncbi:hypothetical protein GW17_00028693 [Ensete ventricosum]|nr:hypothetical protein GW17_00028693 [Ensete ventricosum]
MRQKATSSDLSLQSVYIAARNNRLLPTILIATSNKLNSTAAISHSISLLPSSAIAVYIAARSSSYCSRTLAATDTTCSHEVASQPQPTLLLPSSSSIIAAAFRLRSFGCHLLTNISYQKNHSLDDITTSTLQHQRRTAADDITTSTLQHQRRTAADVTAAIFFLHCCYYLGGHPPLGDFTTAALTSLPLLPST